MDKPIVIPGAFDPTRSLLGRRLRRKHDRLQAEARYYLYVVTGAVLLILASFALWAVFRDRILSEAGGAVAVTYFGAQLISVVCFTATCLVGFRPATRIDVSGRAVRFVRGTSTLEVPTADILNIETVPALSFHRTYRRLDRVRIYPGRGSVDYLLIRTDEIDVALGLEESRRLELAGALRKQPTNTASDLVGAAG